MKISSAWGQADQSKGATKQQIEGDKEVANLNIQGKHVRFHMNM